MTFEEVLQVSMDDPVLHMFRHTRPMIDWTQWEDPHTLDNWLEAIKFLNGLSSPGIDGITFLELKQLPDVAIDSLRRVVHGCLSCMRDGCQNCSFSQRDQPRSGRCTTYHHHGDPMVPAMVPGCPG